MRREDYAHRRSGNVREFLFNLSNMVMAGDAVGADILIGFAKTKPAAATAAGAGHARFRVNHDARGPHDTGTEQRQEREQRRGGITAWIRY